MVAYIVAEIGVNHDGSVDKALELIKKASECGCDAVKFQGFKAELLVDKSAKKVNYQLRSGDKDESHFDMIKRLEFNGEKLKKAAKFAKAIGIDFITTPYDKTCAKEAYKIGIRKFKTASADLCDLYLHNYLASLPGIEVIIATGMSTIQRIESTLRIYKQKLNPILLHCVSEYPCSDNSLNLMAMDLMKEKFPSNEIGFSDHSIGSTAAIICASKGYNFFEKHFTLNKEDNGPDHFASADISEMKSYVNEIRRIDTMLGAKIKEIQKEEFGMSLRSKKGIKALNNIKKGDLITLKNTYAIRPAEYGFSIDDLEKLLFRKAIIDIEKDTFIKEKFLR